MVAQAYRRHMANREILHTMEALQARGAVARYYAVDVRDAAGLADVVQRGPAEPWTGYRPDSRGGGPSTIGLIIEKTLEQFTNVVDTKLRGWFNLARATRNEPLRTIVLFSSVSARFGNAGQVDYAMANEALNKIAREEALFRPGCRVLSMNWGPWDGGMVSPPLKREFMRRNIPLIPLASGASWMFRELAAREAGRGGGSGDRWTAPAGKEPRTRWDPGNRAFRTPPGGEA